MKLRIFAAGVALTGMVCGQPPEPMSPDELRDQIGAPPPMEVFGLEERGAESQGTVVEAVPEELVVQPPEIADVMEVIGPERPAAVEVFAEILPALAPAPDSLLGLPVDADPRTEYQQDRDLLTQQIQILAILGEMIDQNRVGALRVLMRDSLPPARLAVYEEALDVLLRDWVEEEIALPEQYVFSVTEAEANAAPEEDEDGAFESFASPLMCNEITPIAASAADSHSGVVAKAIIEIEGRRQPMLRDDIWTDTDRRTAVKLVDVIDEGGQRPRVIVEIDGNTVCALPWRWER